MHDSIKQCADRATEIAATMMEADGEPFPRHQPEALADLALDAAQRLRDAVDRGGPMEHATMKAAVRLAVLGISVMAILHSQGFRIDDTKRET